VRDLAAIEALRARLARPAGRLRAIIGAKPTRPGAAGA